MKTYALVAADLFACLAIVFLVALGTLATLVNQEVLTYIETTKTDQQNDPSAPDPRETALLEMLHTKDGEARYQLAFPGKEKRLLNGYEAMVSVLRQERPQDMRIRVDRRVNSGLYQDVILDAKKLNIRPWQDNDAQ